MTVIEGDCTDRNAWRGTDGIRAVITSPPYAQQRKGYRSVSPADYPQFTVDWMEAALGSLLPNAAIAIVIRPNQIKGRVSDYVLRTRIAVQEAGWLESEELIWVKPDPPPLGSTRRPRRAWESILIYSRSENPYMNTRAGGRHTDRVYHYGDISARSGELHAGQTSRRGGRTRGTDVVFASCGNGIDKRWPHPAPFPRPLASHLVELLSAPGEFVCDPFAGSGTTGAAALAMGRAFVGIDCESDYVKLANLRLTALADDGEGS